MSIVTTKKPQFIELSKKFKRDLDKLNPDRIVSASFAEVIFHLTNGLPLPEKYRDHALSGDMAGLRDCHIFNDLVLIYQIENEVLSFIRLGSHAEVFG